MKQGARPRSHTHLVIARLDPLLIKAMVPKVALAVIRSVRFPAVGAPGSMRARSALWRSQSGGNRVRVPLATSRQGAMVFLAVGTRASRTLALESVARRRGVTPLPAPDAEGRPRVRPGLLEDSNVLSKLDFTLDEGLSPGATDRVSDVEIHRAGVGLGGVTNHPGRGGEDDEAAQPRLCDLRHHVLRRDVREALARWFQGTGHQRA
jgi:hypothetical protein